MTERGNSDGNNEAVPRPAGLDPLGLMDAFRRLSEARSTGTLTVRGAGGGSWQFYFRDGLVKLAVDTAARGDSLEQALLCSGGFSPEEIGAARQRARREGKGFAQVLLEAARARGSSAGALLDSRTSQEAARLLDGKDIVCHFSEGTEPLEAAEPYAERLGGLDARRILEGFRRAAAELH